MSRARIERKGKIVGSSRPCWSVSENHLTWIIFTVVGLFCGKHHCCLLVQPKASSYMWVSLQWFHLFTAAECQGVASTPEWWGVGLQTFMLYTEAECTSGPCRGITTVKSSICRRQGVGLDHPLSGLHSSTREWHRGTKGCTLRDLGRRRLTQIDQRETELKFVSYVKKTTSIEKCKAKIDTEYLYICTPILGSDICQHTSTHKTVQVSSLPAIAPRIWQAYLLCSNYLQHDW